MMAELHGVLVIDKPAGMTSADVVHRVKRALRAERVGHTGTLDPMATGVLPLCLGQATKIAGYLLAEDKAYEAELELGIETDTLDAEGAITRRDSAGAAAVSRSQLVETAEEFIGPGEQVPPMYSALRHEGKRLHELARAGKTVERPPRPIIIHELRVVAFEPPRARLFVHCSKGTYVRSLVADLGQRLGCGAHISALRRVQSGAFTLATSLQLGEIDEESAQRALITPAAALAHLPALTVAEPLLARVASGQRIPWAQVAGAPAAEESGAPRRAAAATIHGASGAAGTGNHPLHRVLTPEGELLALVAADDQGMVRYERVFTYSLTKRPLSSNLTRSQGRRTQRE
jgi:tRNA pseudouridine55 synthase